MSKYTPGTWHATEPESEGDTPEDIANALLIAAAPDLLAACEAALDLLDDQLIAVFCDPGDDCQFDMLRAAIAKAKGGAA